MDSNSTPTGGDGDKNLKEEKEDESSFMGRLKSAPWEPYCYQKDMIFHRFRRRVPFVKPLDVYRLCPREYDAYENQSFPIVRARDLDGGVKHYSFDELMQMTDCLKSSTFVCYTVLGTLHRGTIQDESGRRRDVLVKTWEYFFPQLWQTRHQTTRIHDELNLLRVPEIRSHPNVVNLIGFHCERRLAVIYEGASLQILCEIIPTDTFSWKDRMKVANEMASMLETFHNKGLVHGGVNSETILVAEDKSPVVYDFGSFSYFKSRETYAELIQTVYPIHYKYLKGPPWSMKCDIFAFGVLLLELISKLKYRDFVGSMGMWTEHEILNYDHKKSAVDYSFCVDEQVALRFTKLARGCLKVSLDEQPAIWDIVRELKELEDLMLHSPPNKQQKISY